MKTQHLRFTVSGGQTFLVPLAQKRYAQRIRNSEDNTGHVPAGACCRLFKGRPELHRSMTLGEALAAAGFREEAAT